MLNLQFVRRIRQLLPLLLIALLCSCSHMKRNDGPPNFYVDETKIPNAVPKAEPLAKYGNYKSYVVLGKRYYTLKTSKNYSAVGTASWYGTKFHARKTSSGESYNMLGMTAAHKTLPLPTYVEVTNLRNHRKVIVKVNDRGPFESNRLIDLSYVAAKKLGMLGHGTAQVRIRAINPGADDQRNELASTDPFSPFLRHKNHAPAVPITHGGVYIQVGAFKQRANAEQMRRRLASKLNMPVYIYAPSGSSSLYRVKVGPIRDAATAKHLSKQLAYYGFKSNKNYGA